MTISFIIPVYNTDNFLDKCIQSVLSQRFTDFEVLLINDGSKDDSGAICDSYAQKDKRVKVFHQENKGVSAARNKGLDHALGEWIFFVDSDDFILDNSLIFLENKENILIKDIVMFKTSTLRESVITNDKTNGESVRLTNELWRYIFKKEIIVENQIRFINIKYGEDFNFIAKYFSVCKTKKKIDEFVYVYRADTPNSAMNKTKNICYVFDHFAMINDLIDFFVSSGGNLNKKALKNSIVRGFKITLNVMAKTSIYKMNENEIVKKYATLYALAFKKNIKLYRFHPLLLKFWINYYKKRV